MDSPQSGSLRFAVRGMTCAACAAKVEKALRGVPGVREAAVNLAVEKAYIRGQALDAGALAGAVEQAGYRLIPEADAVAESARERVLLRRDFLVSAALAAPVAAFSMLPGRRGLIFALATAAQFGPGRRFLRPGLKGLLRGAPDMNSLVLLGTGAAYLYSCAVVFAPSLLSGTGGALYFEAAAVTIAVTLGGRLLQENARARASEAVRGLGELLPKTARVLRGEEEKEIPVAGVGPGDIVCVRPGERLPCDGTVTEGESRVAEAMISGEPLPVRKFPGERVVGGTINGEGWLRFRAEAVGEDTVLAGIIRLVENAQGKKPPIQDLADALVARFVPAVLLLAALTFGAWLVLPGGSLSLGVSRAAAVLLAACPCAMGLATPAALTVALGEAARDGLLFRNPGALQALAGVRIFAFDKTGTLTEGRPALTEVLPAPGVERGRALSLASTVESRSEHPLGRAIAQAGAAEGLKLLRCEEFTAVPGRGAQAEVEGRLILVGSEAFLKSQGVLLGGLAEEGRRLARSGRTVVYAAGPGGPLAAFGISDPLKPEAPAAVSLLKALGGRPVLLTGDSAPAAQAAAGAAGIPEAHAELLPDQKVRLVSGLQAEGPLAFIGDGINDAPAIAQADVGIALGAGADVAAETADILLISGNLAAVPKAAALARKTLRVIRQNLFWAFFYNILLLPLAAGALAPAWGLSLNPMLSAAAMSLSSVCVLLNSLRLRSGRSRAG